MLVELNYKKGGEEKKRGGGKGKKRGEEKKRGERRGKRRRGVCIVIMNDQYVDILQLQT